MLLDDDSGDDESDNKGSEEETVLSKVSIFFNYTITSNDSSLTYINWSIYRCPNVMSVVNIFLVLIIDC